MGNLSKEQEQAIARSTMYLVAALLSILVILQDAQQCCDQIHR